MFLGDSIYQAISDPSRENSEGIDLKAAARMALVGATLHGPYFYATFSAVDTLFGPSTSLVVILKKTLFVQSIVFPVYLYALFGYLGLLEGRKWPLEVIANSIAKTPAAFIAGSVFWPIVNIVGFRLVPPQSRVIYLASTGVAWNTFISHTNRTVPKEVDS
jgi:hypothetical protein